MKTLATYSCLLLLPLSLQPLVSSAKTRSPKLARVLPSQVKTIHLASRKPLPKAQKKTKKADEIPALESPSEEENLLLDPGTSQFRTRTVFFWHSSARLPSSYICDEALMETKKREAENQALAKCLAQGKEECELNEVHIEKNGPLHCKDIPGTACRRNHHYAGCVAVAVVLGQE